MESRSQGKGEGRETQMRPKLEESSVTASREPENYMKVISRNTKYLEKRSRLQLKDTQR